MFYPREFGEQSWIRFARQRRARYRSCAGGQPSDLQEQLIRQLLITKWNEFECEHDRKMRGAWRLVSIAMADKRQLEARRCATMC